MQENPTINQMIREALSDVSRWETATGKILTSEGRDAMVLTIIASRITVIYTKYIWRHGGVTTDAQE